MFRKPGNDDDDDDDDYSAGNRKTPKVSLPSQVVSEVPTIVPRRQPPNDTNFNLVANSTISNSPKKTPSTETTFSTAFKSSKMK